MDNVASNIQNILPQHKAQIGNLKQDGLGIVGYCRKSNLEKPGNLINLLQCMVNDHYQRSLAGTPLAERDLSDQYKVLSKLDCVHGSLKGRLMIAIV